MPSLDGESCAKHNEDQDQSNPRGDPQQGLLDQVYEWLQHEKTRRQSRKARRSETKSHATPQLETPASDGPLENPTSSSPSSSESSFSLDQLEKILLKYGPNSDSVTSSIQRKPTKKQSRRRLKGLRRGSASESELTDADAPPPGVEAFLDNTKTLAYSGGTAVEETGDSSASIKQAKDAEAWVTFKTEIVRLVHTLQLKGWRKVPADMAVDIEVVRLSGALTNAVYVVKPPKNLPPPKTDSNNLVSKKPPP